MYGCFVTPPDDDGADFGVLFWHKDGYSTACGHGTIALGTWAVESGRVGAESDGDTDVVIDVPSGRVTARVSCRHGEVESVAFRNVAAYVLARDVPLDLPSGSVSVDVSYGGAIYASVPASAFGLAVSPSCYADLIVAGREVKRALAASPHAHHPSDARLSGVYGTILYDDLGDGPDGPRQRNVTVFADGEVDRSPCGSGTSARVALLADDGRLGPGRLLTHDSIVDTRFTASVVGTTVEEGRAAVVTEVRGAAYRTGEHTFVIDPRDPVGTGFVLR
jgi:proline racemase